METMIITLAIILLMIMLTMILTIGLLLLWYKENDEFDTPVKSSKGSQWA
jgi:hypothetical protein